MLNWNSDKFQQNISRMKHTLSTAAPVVQWKNLLLCIVTEREMQLLIRYKDSLSKHNPDFIAVVKLRSWNKTRVVFRLNVCLYRMVVTAQRDDSHQSDKTWELTF